MDPPSLDMVSLEGSHSAQIVSPDDSWQSGVFVAYAYRFVAVTSTSGCVCPIEKAQEDSKVMHIASKERILKATVH